MAKENVYDIEIMEESFKELIDDPSFPRVFKDKINDLRNILKDKDDDVSIRINRVIDELDNIANDVNVQPFSRTIIFNMISYLESLLHK